MSQKLIVNISLFNIFKVDSGDDDFENEDSGSEKDPDPKK